MKSAIQKYTTLLILIITIISCNSQIQVDNQNNEITYDNFDLDSFALVIAQEYQLPGLAIATIKDSEITDLAIVGKNKPTYGVLLNKDSKFQIASCTKSFTVLLVASFIEDNLIEWDSKISDIFSDMEIHDDYKNITIRQVLSHTAGLPHFWTDEEVFNIHSIIPDFKGNIKEKRRIFTSWNLAQEACFNVGEHNYSNGGYVIIASLLEKLSGKSYELLMQERIFNVLDLNSAEFGYPFLYDTSQPYRHMERDETGVGITLDSSERMPDKIFNPSGFISITIEDFARYITFYTKVLMNNETGITSDIVKEMFKPEIKLDDGNEVGLGWQIIYVNGVKTYGHTGSDQTMRAAMSINPQTGQAVVFVTNIGDQRSEMAMVNVIFEILSLQTN